MRSMAENALGVISCRRISKEFSLAKRPDKVYGWAVDDGTGKPQFIAVLGGERIGSAIAAVRAWIVSQAKK